MKVTSNKEDNNTKMKTGDVILLINNQLMSELRVSNFKLVLLFGYILIKNEFNFANIIAFKHFTDMEPLDSMSKRQKGLIKCLGIIYSSNHHKNGVKPFGQFFTQVKMETAQSKPIVESIWVESIPISLSSFNLIFYNPDQFINSGLIFDDTFLSHLNNQLIQFCTENVRYTIKKLSTIKKMGLTAPLRPKTRYISLFKNEWKFSKFKHFINYISPWICLISSGRVFYFRIRQVLSCLSSKKEKDHIRLLNTLSGIAIDIIMGIIVILLLNTYLNSSNWYGCHLKYADLIVTKIEELIYSLFGMPGGLKLNLQLKTSLDSFFLYHIYIWKTYIAIVSPIFKIIFDLLIFFSLFGLTSIMSILSDLFALATIHIFCFYGYAARLYGFEFSSLISLWRLFRGKKWNSLKKRVDSFSYESDQLFLGTLSFTILMFLMPTILLYYIVFLFLRLITLTIQIMLQTLIGYLLVFPFYSIFLWAKGSEKISREIFFSNNQKHETEMTILDMNLKSISFKHILQNAHSFYSHFEINSNPFAFSKLLPESLIESIYQGKLL